MKIQLVAAILGLVAAGGAHLAQKTVDPVRRLSQEQWKTVAMPNADTLRVASMGQPTLTADLVWLRTVLRFSDTYENPEQSDVVWLAAMVDAVVALDPRWRTAYFYGGSMLRVVGDIDGSDRIFTLAREQPAFATDPYFPFALGINAWLHRSDPAQAAVYLHEAANLPGAPAWYRAAAAGIVDQEQGRAAAIDMLRHSIASETDDRVRGFLEDKLKRLMHDELSHHLSEAIGAAAPPWRARITTLPGGQALPPDPLGGAWVVGADGKVRSDVAEEELRSKALNAERHWLIFPVHTRVWDTPPAGAASPAGGAQEDGADSGP